MGDYFIYDGGCSLDLDIIINKVKGYLSSPNRKVQVIEIDGRNGALLIDDGSWENKKIEVEACIDSCDPKTMATKIKRWLQSDFSYKRLEFSFLPDYYFEASVINKLDIEEVIEILGEFKITFECKPLNRDKYGDGIIVITEPKSLYNEGLKSEPYIKIVGDGDITLNINNQSINLKGVEGHIEIDTELYNCFKGEANQNNKMYAKDFPYLEEGSNDISWNGNVSRIEIIPRWVVL